MGGMARRLENYFFASILNLRLFADGGMPMISAGGGVCFAWE
jgi:hypothetical protein